jgi:tetratricopeptide (TPR) repeat protein
MNKLEKAMEDHKQGLWEKADNAYNDIIQEEPDNSDVMYLLATSKMSQNKLQESLELINKCIELNEKAPAFFQLKGSLLARMGQTKEALEAINSALDENPNLYQSHIVAGHLNYTQGDQKKAEKHFTSALKIDSKTPEAHVNLAKILIDNGDIEKAISSLREIELQHPEQASVKMMLGQAFIENGAYNFAENYFQKVLAMHPEYALAGLYLGIAKIQTGDLENAEKLIHAFNTQHQNTREGIAAMGLWLFHSGRFKAAAEYLKSAIGNGLAPLSWKAAFVEALARLGQYQPAIDFYKQRTKKNESALINYRLGELYELQKEYKKAIKEFKSQTPQDIKYIAAQLGLARCYLNTDNAEKAEKYCKNVLERNIQHAEATYLLVITLLELDKPKKALNILEALETETYTETYKKAFQMMHGLILDKKEKYKKAFKVFTSTEKNEIPEYRKMKEEEVKQIQKFDTKINDEKKDPVFLVGTKSTGLNEFVNWLYEQKNVVLNDRLVSNGREDILHSFVEMDKLKDADEDMVRLERKIYHQKVKALLGGIEEETQFVDAMYINPYQLGIIKKFFPEAKVILLTRNSADLWLSQQVYGAEPIDSKEWNEAKNQVISMGLNLIQIETNDWLNGKKETMKKLEEIFDKKLNPFKAKNIKYWNQTLFPEGHWKHYKQFLGQ